MRTNETTGPVCLRCSVGGMGALLMHGTGEHHVDAYRGVYRAVLKGRETNGERSLWCNSIHIYVGLCGFGRALTLTCRSYATHRPRVSPSGRYITYSTLTRERHDLCFLCRTFPWAPGQPTWDIDVSSCLCASSNSLHIYPWFNNITAQYALDAGMRIFRGALHAAARDHDHETGHHRVSDSGEMKWNGG